MIPIYIVNLDKDIERLKHVTDQLTKLGLPWERFPAVKGSDITPEFLDRENARTRDRKLSYMEIGCLMSHMQLWRKVVDLKLPYALIMEDDVLLAQDLASIIKDASWLPSDNCIVRLETFSMFGSYGQKVADINGRGLYPLRSIQHGGAAYILTYKRAVALVGEYEKYIDAADHMIFRYPRQHNVYQFSPAPAIQLGIYRDGHIRTHSIIESERVHLKRKSLYEPSTMLRHSWWRFTSIMGIIRDVLLGYRLQKVPYKD